MSVTTPVITDLSLPGLTLFKKGKVRHVYDLGENLLFVATDRVSAFDFIYNEGVPGKGEILTGISTFWFKQLEDIIPNHFVSADVDTFPEETRPYHDILRGRTLLVKKTRLIEIECVVRGYLAGSGWKEYQQHGTVCKQALPSGLQLASQLPEPIFTPAIKAREGHDENISIEQMQDMITEPLAARIISISKQIYQRAHDHMAKRGIILADTKFEFGLLDGELILIDEVLTADSSRYWPVETYQEGISPPSYDKQILRDYLESTWDKKPPIPTLPEHIINKLSAQYQKVYQLITEA